MFPQTDVFVNVFLHTVDIILITPTHVETVVLLNGKKVDGHISIDLDIKTLKK